MSEISSGEWEKLQEQYPRAHVLQTSAWGKVKSGFGWAVKHVAQSGAGAQILFRKLPLGFHIAYLPKGPLGEDWTTLWPEMDKLCRRMRTIFLKVEPDAWEEDAEVLLPRFPNFRHPAKSIQPRRTIIVDLTGEPDSWMERMKQKHRYNTRLAVKKEVVVQSSSDIGAFHQMMLTTGLRDTFGVHSRDYYQKVYDHFSPAGKCLLLLAAYEGQPLAGVMVLREGQRAWYFYGASNNLERQRMPAYLLQFEAMKWAKEMGCNEYDLWGVPDEDEATLEREFENRNDGLWGVYRFKRGFGGTLKRSLGALDKVYIPSLYGLYNRYLQVRGGWNG